MDLGFACNAPMSIGLSPIRLADRPSPLPPHRAGALVVHRQPRASLNVCLIRAREAEEKPAPSKEPAFKPKVFLEPEPAVPPARHVNFAFVLTEIRGVMLAFNLAVHRDEIMFPGLAATSSPYDPLNRPRPYKTTKPPRLCPIDVCA